MDMKKIIAAVIGLSMPLLVHAGDLSARVGEDFVGASYEGNFLLLTGSADWLRNVDKGNIASLGLGVQAPLGIVKLKAGGKMVMLDLNNQGKEYAGALGAGLEVPVGDFTAYAQGYFATAAMSTSGVDMYQEMRAGVRWNVNPMLALDLGYQYADVDGKNGKQSQTLAQGVYAGAQLSF